MNDASIRTALSQHTIWSVDRVKDHALKIGSGLTPSGGSASYLDKGVPLLRSQNVHFGGLRLADVAFIAMEAHNKMAGTKLSPRDVLLNITGASIGRCTYVPDGFGEGNVNQHVSIIRPFGRLHYKYLTYCLTAPWGQDQIFSAFTGASREGLGRRNLGEIEVPLPPLSEQKRIAAFLDVSCKAIDQAVETKQKQLETLDVLRKSIILSAVTQGLNLEVKMKDSGVDWLGPVPVHWTVSRIKRHTSMIRGKFTHRPRNDPSLYNGPYPFFQTGSIARAEKYITEYKQTLNEQGLAVSRLFPRGIIVMSIAANIGDVAITDFEGCFPDSIVGFVPDHHTDANFLFYLLKSMKPIMLRSAILTTQLNLNYVRIGANFCAYPPKDEQKKIGDYLDRKMDESRKVSNTIREQISTLTAYRKSLIHECVTGKRRISDADVAKVEAHV